MDLALNNLQWFIFNKTKPNLHFPGHWVHCASDLKSYLTQLSKHQCKYGFSESKASMK